MKKRSASLLLSACLFLSLLLLLISGYLHVYERQMRTLQLAQQNYQAACLIDLAQWRQQHGESQACYRFNLGNVTLTGSTAVVELKGKQKPIVKKISPEQTTTMPTAAHRKRLK